MNKLPIFVAIGLAVFFAFYFYDRHQKEDFRNTWHNALIENCREQLPGHPELAKTCKEIMERH